MLIKLGVTSFFLITLLGLQTNSCNHRTDDKWVSLGGPTKSTSVVILFKKDTANDDIEDFLRDVVQIEKYDLALKFRFSRDGYDGVGVNFSTDTTPEQRENLRKSIQESPIVYRVFENVVPSDVKLE